MKEEQQLAQSEYAPPALSKPVASSEHIAPLSQPAAPPDYVTPPLSQKIKLYIAALLSVCFYRYGEIGNICYTIGKNILDGVILYTMFSMAEEQLKVAAILGVVVKYAYPGISMISSTCISGYIDHLEATHDPKTQIARLIRAQLGVATGQSLGAICLLLCFPPVFMYFFGAVSFKPHLLVLIYLLHHVCDGSAQIVEGRTWFKIIEIKIRKGEDKRLSRNFWVIYTLAQNFQLLLGQLFIWGTLAMTTEFSPNLTAPLLSATVYTGFLCVVASKFILPAMYKMRLCS
ncbi:hypothetical protein LPW11_01865 [Geomonas sp. RF6]|uniref:hypothetical protein n=1 Tax=Geomonas sp. RF6 TaxID=2897342 RepID=UPI001E4A1624|nr:hypothetical protein [Geomonas sp. RF6]UFS70943.1 hypothetical protein LPW11_01865 [Geomonas sp. RF6]